MEMDYNLKKMANFFKFFLYISEKSLKTDYSLFFLGQITKLFSPWCSKSNFMLEKRFFVKCLSRFYQNTIKLP